MPDLPLIAVVDDEESVRRALQRLLRAENLAAVTYASGEEFLQSLANRPPDCLVLDLHMPGLDGLAVQARLAEGGWRLPVLFITAGEELSSRERAFRCGAVAWLRKPIDGGTIMEAIGKALGQR